MTMTSKVHPYKTGMGPFAPEVYRAPFPNEYRGPAASEALDGARADVRVPRGAVPGRRDRLRAAARRGRVRPGPAEFVEGLRRICDREGIVLVADEVQTGFGRTGRMFAMEHYEVEPDLMVVAKSIAAGLPLSGVIGKAEIMDAPHARRDRRDLHRQPDRPRRCARRPRRLRRGGARRPRRARSATAIRARMLALAGALAADRRRARARCDARDRARPRSGRRRSRRPSSPSP